MPTNLAMGHKRWFLLAEFMVVTSGTRFFFFIELSIIFSKILIPSPIRSLCT